MLIKEMKNEFNISNLHVLNAFLKLDPQKIPNKDSLLFGNYGRLQHMKNKDMRQLHALSRNSEAIDV